MQVLSAAPKQSHSGREVTTLHTVISHQHVRGLRGGEVLTEALNESLMLFSQKTLEGSRVMTSPLQKQGNWAT